MKDKKIAEIRFREYPYYDREINSRKFDLLCSKEEDVNAWIRAKGKNSKAAESELIRFESDKYIQNRLFWKRCVEETLEELDDKQKEYVAEYYFDDVYDYRSLAKKHFTNRNVIMNACNLACELLLVKLGEKF
jgi:RinA family phage transcriptional activator